MLESIVRENPLFAVAIVVGLAILVTLLASAWISTRRSKRQAASVRHEPVFVGGHVDEGEAAPQYDISSSRHDDPRPRRRYGFGALVASFVIGALAGLGGWAIASNDGFRPAIETLVGLAEAGISRTREVAGLDNPSEVPSDASSVETGDKASEIEARLAFFAGKLKGALPRDAGPELVLTRVDVTGMTLNLDYTLGRSLTDDQIADFDAYLMRSIQSLLCDKESRELRFLNDNGVAFRMAYTDLRGESVAELAIPPGFCA
ncbi:MAG: hypothetical protein GY798_16040 [Hyphomicrobiales bacterium]|nr:hypothetical protein [Hyphomicrobiales bacterium]